jgi:hypothetical protein
MRERRERERGRRADADGRILGDIPIAGWIWLRSASISFGWCWCRGCGLVRSCVPRPPGCGGLLRVAMLSVSGLAAPVAAFRRLVPCAVFNSVPGSDENSLGNRGGSPPVLRRIYFSFSELSSFSFSLGENDGFFLGN